MFSVNESQPELLSLWLLIRRKEPLWQNPETLELSVSQEEASSGLESGRGMAGGTGKGHPGQTVLP